MTRTVLVLLLLAGLAGCQNAGRPVSRESAGSLALVRAATKDGRLAWMLTEPQEAEALLGPPEGRETKEDGGMSVLFYRYADVQLMFGKFREKPAPFTLRAALALSAKTSPDGAAGGPNPERVDIGQDRPVVLRNAGDLGKFDDFWGFAGVSLEKCDLRERADLLRAMPFDTRTVWPPAERLPDGFKPDRLLEEGKDPGLGIRGLHARGVDGRGVRIAIIDQPMKPDHREFKEQLERYEVVGAADVPPQMHGPPVASIAVGQTCGVAPRARLSFFAIPMWRPENAPYCDIIDKILKENEAKRPAERIRVVSISTGMFSSQSDFDRWRDVTRRAAESGLLIITCDQEALRYGTLRRVPGADADDPRSYRAGPYGVTPASLLIPAGGRTTASHQGPDVYTYWVEGGMSWAAPYLAGTAALAFQVKPDITPERILALLRETASQTDAGRVINPGAFIDAVRRE